ncbi:acyltransferase [Pigmentibacter ruber]|uniref:acyltransferase n=1 Tax=Pigmentibacter ruber TaxID=2683196 RepID=UPI00131C5A2C|nr:acyltransferase [Pigmentibacter ruber]BFD31208.1 hypothetical protein GTC16762_08260 [Pigmentibacter ruber]
MYFLYLLKRVITKLIYILSQKHYKSMLFSFGNSSHIVFPAEITENKGLSIGNHVIIKSNSWLNCRYLPLTNTPSLVIQDGCYLGRFIHINAFQDVLIEKNVLIADRVHISDATHYYDKLDIPIIKQGAGFVAPVKLLEGCWIGVGAVILPGVTIGKHAIIGANAVVTKSIPDYAVAGGVPAKIIKFRESKSND